MTYEISDPETIDGDTSFDFWSYINFMLSSLHYEIHIFKDWNRDRFQTLITYLFGIANFKTHDFDT